MKEAVIFGAGNIGRGFLGQLLSESGYLVTFVDVDRRLLETLNARGRYTIRLVTNDRAEEVEVGPVRALFAEDTPAVAAALSRAEIGATAVGAGALKHIAPVVAQGIAQRAERGVTAPLNLIICENLHGAAAHFRAMVQAALPHAELTQNVGFVDTVIARMVPPLTPELRAQDPSLILVEPYKELPVDRDGFVGAPPAIVGMVPFAPFGFFTDRKLYIHNAGHAVLGYLGYLAGYEYGYQALADDDIYFQVRGAMEESALAMTRTYRPAPGHSWLISRTFSSASAIALSATRFCDWGATRAQAGVQRSTGRRGATGTFSVRDAHPSGHRDRQRPPLRPPGRSAGCSGPVAPAIRRHRASAGRGVRAGAGRAALGAHPG